MKAGHETTSASPESEARPPAPEPFRARQAMGLLTLYFFAQLLAGLAMGVWLGARFLLGGGDPTDVAAITSLSLRIEGPVGVMGAALGGLVVLLVVMHRSRRQPDLRAQLGLRRGPPRALAAGAAIGIAIAIAYLVAAVVIPVARGFTPGPLGRMAATPGWQRELWGLAAILLFPAAEELVFRSVLYSGLRGSWGAGPAAVLTTVLFVASHVFEFQTYVPAACAIAALGIVTLALRVRTGALGPAIATHLAYNVAVVALARLAMAST